MPDIPGLAALELAVELRRGKSANEIFGAVRKNCSFGPDISDEQVFLRTCIAYFGHWCAQSRVRVDYWNFVMNRDMPGYQLPEYVARYGDNDKNINYRI